MFGTFNHLNFGIVSNFEICASNLRLFDYMCKMIIDAVMVSITAKRQC
jgi:hypothetical protein